MEAPDVANMSGIFRKLEEDTGRIITPAIDVAKCTTPMSKRLVKYDGRNDINDETKNAIANLANIINTANDTNAANIMNIAGCNTTPEAILLKKIDVAAHGSNHGAMRRFLNKFGCISV